MICVYIHINSIALTSTSLEMPDLREQSNIYGCRGLVVEIQSGDRGVQSPSEEGVGKGSIYITYDVTMEKHEN